MLAPRWFTCERVPDELFNPDDSESDDEDDNDYDSDDESDDSDDVD